MARGKTWASRNLGFAGLTLATLWLSSPAAAVPTCCGNDPSGRWECDFSSVAWEGQPRWLDPMPGAEQLESPDEAPVEQPTPVPGSPVLPASEPTLPSTDLSRPPSPSISQPVVEIKPAAAPQTSPSGPASPPVEEVPSDEPAPALEQSTRGFPRLIHQGQIQFQVDDGSLGSPRASSPFPSSNGIGPFPADSRLFVRRFRPAFNLAMSPSFDFQTEFNIDPQSERIQILDVRFNYDLSESTYLSVGRYKVPFGWEGLRSSRTTNTIERSDMTSALYPERDVGLSLTHQESRLGLFSLGTFLGQPRSNGGSNDHLDVVGRALFRVNDDLKLGVSGHVGTYRPSNTEFDFPVRRLGTELQYSSGPLRLESEVMWSDGYNTISRINSRAFGYYAAAIYRLSGPWDLVFQYDNFDPDLDAVDHVRPSNEENARDRKVVGLNYYIDREKFHRFMINYEIKQDLEGARLHTQGFRVRYQLAW